MSDTTTLALDAIFAKTPLGQQEIQQRTLKLPLLMRRVLLLVDGRRPVAELATLAGDADIGSLLAELGERGCIVRVASPPAAGSTRDAGSRAADTAAPAAPAPARPAAPPPQGPLAALPPAETRSEVDVGMARNFMINSVGRMLDPVTAAPFVARLSACRTAEELRACYREWAEIVGAGWGGGKRLEDLRAKLFAVL